MSERHHQLDSDPVLSNIYSGLTTVVEGSQNEAAGKTLNYYVTRTLLDN